MYIEHILAGKATILPLCLHLARSFFFFFLFLEMMFLYLSEFFAGITEIEGLNYGYGSQPRAQRPVTRPLSGSSNGSRWRMSSLKFFIEWPNNVWVQSNDTISRGLSVKRPRLVWGAESNALYIIVFFGGWSDRVLLKGTAMLWVVTNLPGNSVTGQGRRQSH